MLLLWWAVLLIVYGHTLGGMSIKGIDLETWEEIAIKLEHIGDNMPT